MYGIDFGDTHINIEESLHSWRCIKDTYIIMRIGLGTDVLAGSIIIVITLVLEVEKNYTKPLSIKDSFSHYCS